MGYVINKEGKKIEVNNPDGLCAENVVLINDDTILVNKYMLSIYRKYLYDKNFESEFITEIIFDDEPTNEQIIFHMSQNNVNRYSGFVVLEKIKVLDFKNEE